MTTHASARTVALLALRTARGMTRKPELVLTPIAFAAVLSLVNLGALHSASRLPGAPGNAPGFAFFLPCMAVQLVTVGATNHALDLAEDLDNGFHSRMRLTPAARPLLLTGLLAAAVVVDVLIALATVAVLGPLTGLGTTPAGFAGFALLLLVYATTANALFTVLAFRTRSATALQYVFPLFLLALFTSSGFFTDALMSDWFRALVDANPLTALIDELRAALLTGPDAGSYGRVLGAAGLAAAVALTGAARSLARGRSQA